MLYLVYRYSFLFFFTYVVNGLGPTMESTMTGTGRMWTAATAISPVVAVAAAEAVAAVAAAVADRQSMSCSATTLEAEPFREGC